jgi:ribonuclease HI
MIHVITDGGSNPNPGPAGWGGVISRNGKCTFKFGHHAHARDNAMEIHAVVEALHILPADIHVWVSTDSAYVKKGITEWLPKWVRNHWRNSNGAPVANKSLWDALVEVVKQTRKVEWTLVKGHSGILLNACGDRLATKGVNNEQPPALVQYLVPMGEDINAKVYELRDGEETRVGSNWLWFRRISVRGTFFG